jgi:hypothetical protein
MSIIDRVKNICVSPATEWPVIASEQASTASLISGYLVPLSGLAVVATFIGGSIVGRTLPFIGGTYRVPIVTGLGIACLTFVLGIVGAYVLSLIINALAPTFGGQQDGTQAMKAAVYSYTPAWVGGLFQILPFIGTLAALVGGLFGLYLLYLGLPVLMKSAKEKAAGYTVVVVLCAIVLWVVTSMTVGLLGAGALGAGAFAGGTVLGGRASSDAGEVEFDKNSSLGKLQQIGKAMEESAKKAEAAQKSGDAGAAAAAAIGGLGTLLGGGRTVDPLGLDQLKAFVPGSFAGLAKDGDGSAEKNGLGGVMISRAEQRYGAGQTSATLEITDTGGASGLMGLAGWAAIGSERQDGDGSEKTTKVNGRMVHERRSKSGEDEYTILIGDRFMVTAKSDTLDADALRTAVSALDLSKLEAAEPGQKTLA